MKKIASMVFVSLLSLQAVAEERYGGIPESFIKQLQEKKFQTAIDHLFPDQDYWGTQAGIAEKANFAAKMEKAGDYRFHELLSEKKIGERYAVLSYLVIFQDRPAFLSIVMYKPESSWKGKSFNFDENPNNIKNLTVQWE